MNSNLASRPEKGLDEKSKLNIFFCEKENHSSVVHCFSFTASLLFFEVKILRGKLKQKHSKSNVSCIVNGRRFVTWHILGLSNYDLKNFVCVLLTSCEKCMNLFCFKRMLHMICRVIGAYDSLQNLTCAQPRSQGPLSTSRKYPGYGWSRVC